MSWTEERTDQLKILWADNLSCSQIGAEMGVTRNAVIGKVHRLGLAGRAEKSKLNLQRKGPRKPLGPRKHKSVRSQPTPPEAFHVLYEPSIDDMKIPVEQRKQLTELNADTCRWPIGDPQKPDTFFFCGAVPFLDHPYCHAHCRVAYVPTRNPVNIWHYRGRAA